MDWGSSPITRRSTGTIRFFSPLSISSPLSDSCVGLLSDLTYTWSIRESISRPERRLTHGVCLALSGLNQRRWQLFKANRRGFWSLWIFLGPLRHQRLCADCIANDRPMIASYKGEILFPIFTEYPEEKFGGFLAAPIFAIPSSRTRSRPMAGWSGRHPLFLQHRQQ